MMSDYVPSWLRETPQEKEKRELLEMSIAKEGNAEFPEELLSFKTVFMLERDWASIGKIGKMICFKHKKSGAYLMGKYNDDEKQFEVYLYMELKTMNSSMYTKLGYDKVKYVKGVDVKETSHGDGIATSFYKFLVKELKYTILASEEQYFGARKLWTRLSKALDVTVDIIDIKNNHIMEKSVILHHGNYDHDFDERVWSYTLEKKNIRLILTDIK